MRQLALALVLVCGMVSASEAAVGFDAFSCYNAANPCTQPGPSDVDSFSWTHTPAGTPRAAQCFVVIDVGGGTPTDEIIGITYGGVSMNEMSGSPLLVDQAADNGSVYGYFLDNISTGAQSVVVDNEDAVDSEKTGFCVTMTSGGPALELVDVDASQGNAANPPVTLSLGGRASFVMIGILCGSAAQTAMSPASGWTERPSTDGGLDFGPANAFAATYNTVSTSDVATGGATFPAVDYGMIATAVSEVVAAGGSAVPSVLGSGVIR